MKCFLIGTVYTYLANGVGRRDTQGAFQALSRGFSHWASGRVDHIEVNISHPDYCHVKCSMTHSMKPGNYQVYLLIKCESDLGSVVIATCQCAAGYVNQYTYNVFKYYHPFNRKLPHVLMFLHFSTVFFQ